MRSHRPRSTQPIVTSRVRSRRRVPVLLLRTARRARPARLLRDGARCCQHCGRGGRGHGPHSTPASRSGDESSLRRDRPQTDGDADERHEPRRCPRWVEAPANSRSSDECEQRQGSVRPLTSATDPWGTTPVPDEHVHELASAALRLTPRFARTLTTLGPATARAAEDVGDHLDRLTERERDAETRGCTFARDRKKQRRDRRRALRRRGSGQDARLAHPHQALRERPHAGRRVRLREPAPHPGCDDLTRGGMRVEERSVCNPTRSGGCRSGDLLRAIGVGSAVFDRVS